MNHPIRKTLAAALAGTLAALVAAFLLAACGSHTAGGTTPATHPATPAAVPLSCKQQADAWKTVNATLISQFKNALDTFSAAGTNGSLAAAQGRTLATTATAMGNHPVPACADPRGYYAQMTANLVTAGNDVAMGGLAEASALTPMENAETAVNELASEMQQETGSGTL